MTTSQIISAKPIPRYYLDKHYNDMTRLEKRAYKRWLTVSGLAKAGNLTTKV